MQKQTFFAEGSDAELSRLADRSLDLKLGLPDRRESRDLLLPRAYPPLPQSISGLHREGRIASKQLQQRFDTDITNFMDLVEASMHHPCVKRAWVSTRSRRRAGSGDDLGSGYWWTSAAR